jgi:hypothetical protein
VTTDRLAIEITTVNATGALRRLAHGRPRRDPICPLSALHRGANRSPGRRRGMGDRARALSRSA